MNIIKKDGRIQQFEISKIRMSLQRASDDINSPLTTSDIKNVVEDIDKELKKLKISIIQADKVQETVYNVLLDNGFNELGDYYKCYEKEKK